MSTNWFLLFQISSNLFYFNRVCFSVAGTIRAYYATSHHCAQISHKIKGQIVTAKTAYCTSKSTASAAKAGFVVIVNLFPADHINQDNVTYMIIKIYCNTYVLTKFLRMNVSYQQFQFGGGGVGWGVVGAGNSNAPVFFDYAKMSTVFTSEETVDWK